ncbi:MAG: cysteine--tRNA ligase [Clostridiales bacterium]|nr:cysteine--tRNA ligase [Clostridiales bacterium]MCF8023641.1 cysteine--tRNA ligase [Clostridiales bacterium]
MKIYNTLTGKKENFQPREAGKVSIYVCGPTTYNYIHMGNARPLVFFDTVRRYFKFKGYKVYYVQNFTDVDDKIINRSLKENVKAEDVAERFINEYYRDADDLNVKRADVHPKVSEHINEIIEMIQKLVEKDYAYTVNGNVYFNVSKFNDYGKLSGRCLEDMQAGSRVEVDYKKSNPLDFALWKASKESEPYWDSPWGRGRPGWHIECSAMSIKYLGTSFDVHGGGCDLIFPHHENEIAQSEAATGELFSRYWMHNGFIMVNKEKMSKSLGNFFLVREVLEKFPPDLVRFYLLSTHYRSPLDFDDEKLESSRRGLERIRNSIRLLEEALHQDNEECASSCMTGRLDDIKKSFESAMDDDFNTALAVGTLFDLAHEVNTCVQNRSYCIEDLQKAKELFSTFNNVLGIFKKDVHGDIVTEQAGSEKNDVAEKLMDLILDIRQNARKNKDFATADKIRDTLKEIGITVEDTPNGPRWKI